MEVSLVQLEEIDQLAQLFDAYRVWYRQPSKLEEAKRFLTDRIKNGESVVFVARNETGRLVGFTQLYPLFSSTRMRRIWLLNDLYVDPDFRGQHVSIALIDAAKAHTVATDGAGILLETEKSNTIGNNLYPRTGFHLETNNFYFWTNQ